MNKQEHIDQIMDSFDFRKVALVMDFLKWEWVSSGVPNEYEIRRNARLKLIEVYDKCLISKEDYRIASGGFKAQGYYENGKVESLSLEFVLTCWDTL